MTYEFLIQVPTVAPMGKAVLEGVAQGTASFKPVIGVEKVTNRFYVYVDQVRKGNEFGFIKGGDILKDGDLIDIVRVSNSSDYSIKLSPDTEKTLKAEITFDEQKANKNLFKVSDRLQEIINEKIVDGIITRDGMEERLKVFEENDVPAFIVEQVVSGYRKYRKPVKRPSCIYVDPYPDNRNRKSIISKGLINALMRYGTLCEGEKSTGKNVYIETLAWLLNMPFYLITFSRQMSPSAVYGEKTTDNTAMEKLNDPSVDELARARVMMNAGISDAQNALTIKKAAEFEILCAKTASVNIVIDHSDMYEWLTDGGILVFNEMNMADPNFLASFTNQILDNTGFISFPGRGEVPIHRDCVLFATQNANYEGTAQQNEATMSRFNCIHFKSPESIKDQLVKAVTTNLERAGYSGRIDGKLFDDANKFYGTAQTCVNAGTISNAVLNIRGFVRALTVVVMSEGFCDLNEWIRICVIDTCPVEDRVSLIGALNGLRA